MEQFCISEDYNNRKSIWDFCSEHSILCSGGLGGGDVKLMAASGVLLGVTGNVFAACFGLLLGGFCGLFLLLTKRIGYKECFALGPFLCLGIAIVFFQINFLQ